MARKPSGPPPRASGYPGDNQPGAPGRGGPDPNPQGGAPTRLTRRQLLASIEIPRVPWEEHRAWLDESWKPGDHVSLFAPTDSGKTHLALHGLLPVWPDDYPILIIDVKGDDPTLRGIGRPCNKLPNRFDRHHLHDGPQCYRLVIRESVDDIDAARQRVIEALKVARSETGWLIEINEVRALTDPRPPNLNLAPRLEQLWLRGRPHVTVVAETQRPAFVPGSMYDQPTHVYIGQILDKRAQDRLHEIGGHTDEILAGIQQLGEFEFVYVNRKTKTVEIVQAPAQRDPRWAANRGR